MIVGARRTPRRLSWPSHTPKVDERSARQIARRPAFRTASRRAAGRTRAQPPARRARRRRPRGSEPSCSGSAARASQARRSAPVRRRRPGRRAFVWPPAPDDGWPRDEDGAVATSGSTRSTSRHRRHSTGRPVAPALRTRHTLGSWARPWEARPASWAGDVHTARRTGLRRGPVSGRRRRRDARSSSRDDSRRDVERSRAGLVPARRAEREARS